jgi:hypothetical protein
MNDLRTAAQQALEFVTSKQWGTTPYMDVRVYEDAARLRDKLSAALEQPEQEPVAWMHAQDWFVTRDPPGDTEDASQYVPLYTTPPDRHEAMRKALVVLQRTPQPASRDHIEAIVALRAALGEDK